MEHIKKNIFILLLFIAIASHFLQAEDFTLKSWKTPDGLPQDSILAIAQGSDGYLWLGTGNGLARFDGVKFKVFSRWNTPAMMSDKVTSLLVDKKGELWAGLDGGVLRFYNDKWSTITTTDGLSHSSVTSLYEDRDGNLWIGTLDGVNRLRDGRIESFTSENGLPGNIIQAIGESPDGSVLVGTLANGLAEFSGGAFGIPGYLELCSRHSIAAIRFDGRKASWIGSDYGLFVLKNKSVLQVREAGTPIPAVRSLMLSSDGALWAGTDGNGVFKVDASAEGGIPIVDELKDHFVYAAAQDRDGGFWLGTFTDGLFRLRERKVDNWLDRHAAKERLVNTVLVDHENFCWAGTRKGGLLKLQRGEVIRRFASEAGLECNDVRALFEESPGIIWAGTASGRVVVLKDDHVISSFTISQHGIACSVNVFYKDRGGSLWIGTSRGIAKIQDNKLDDERLLPERNVSVIAEDTKGAIWAGADRGLYYLKDHRFFPFESDSGLLHAGILSFYIDEKDIKWIGTNGDGLLAIKEKTIRRVTRAEGLRDDYILSIQKDSLGRLWMSSPQGVFFAPRSDLEALFDGQRRMVRCRSLDEADGMASRQCNGGFTPSSWMTASGHLLYPTVKGIAVVDPGRLSINAIAPNVVLEEMLADNRSIRDRQSIYLQEDTSVVEFYFTATSFSNPRQIRFEYKLEGFDEDWNALSPQQPRAAMYINLAPGQYRFRVKAANSDGVWNDEDAGVRFRIGAGFPVLVVVFGLLSLAAAAVFFVYRRSTPAKSTVKTAKKYSTSALTEDRALDIQNRLMDLMEKEKVYLDPDLTLKKLSEKLQVHPNYLSQIINETLQQRSSDFINRYRIEYVKKKLLDDGENHKPILDIAFESGFYSKSVFNTAFKKFTGATPSKFRKK